MKIYNQTTKVTSKFNEEMFIEGLNKQLGSEIFKHLIQNEKDGIEITVTMNVVEMPDMVEKIKK